NAGIGGNAVLEGGLGPTALSRLERDVLAQSGARWVILLEGVNDIGGAREPGRAATVAQNLLAAYWDIIARAHDRGLRVYGAAIPRSPRVSCRWRIRAITCIPTRRATA